MNILQFSIKSFYNRYYKQDATWYNKATAAALVITQLSVTMGRNRLHHTPTQEHEMQRGTLDMWPM